MFVCFLFVKALIERNAKAPPPVSADKLPLPFIVINTGSTCKIDLRVSADRSEYRFDFSHPFELHDDPHILIKMGLGGADIVPSQTSFEFADAKK